MTLLRLIESTLPVAISDHLDRHALQCQAEGWVVEDVYLGKASKDVTPAEVGTVIRNWATGKPRPHVLVIGDIATPRSGISSNPDGHETTAGAYPCPAYWATDPARWTDDRTNARPVGQLQPRPSYLNNPGDGIFDQDYLPQSAQVAIGLLNLKAGAHPHWRFTSPRSEWLFEAYASYFTSLHAWRRGVLKYRTAFGCARNSPGLPALWIRDTVADQQLYRADTVNPAAPFGAFLDLKGLPANGTFWFDREQPLAAVYLEYESYQTAWPCSRLVNALMTGSACAVPVGPMLNLAGWQTKTLGELWQQSATEGAPCFLALYGDPTFHLGNLFGVR